MGVMRTVEENNKLIIDFLEVEYSSNDDTYFLPSFGFMNVRGEFQTDFTIGKLKFHSDWNWLMEVVDRIESIDDGAFDVNILKNGTQIVNYAEMTTIVENVASVILVVSVMLWGTIAQTETPTYLAVISVISINLAVCLYHGSKTSK